MLEEDLRYYNNYDNHKLQENFITEQFKKDPILQCTTETLFSNFIMKQKYPPKPIQRGLLSNALR